MSLHKSQVAEKAANSKSESSYYHTQQTRVPIAFTTSESAPWPAKHQLHGAKPAALSRKTPALSSPASNTKSSATKTPVNSVKRENVKGAPSILPRSISSPSSASPSTLVTSTPPPLLSAPLCSSRIPVPADFANGNAPGWDKARRVLRRKAPSVEQYVSSLGRSGPLSESRRDANGDRIVNKSSKSLPERFGEHDSDVTPGAASSGSISSNMQPKQRTEELPPALIPELKALAAASVSSRTASSKPDLPSISSPSTQCSGSTGPWSSRDTTPTSLSSCSPGIVQPSRVKTISRLRRAIPPPHKPVDTLTFETKGSLAADEASSLLSLDETSKNANDHHPLPQQHRKTQSRRCRMPDAPKPPTRNPSIGSKSSQQATKEKVQVLEKALSECVTRLDGSRELWEEPAPDVVTSAQDRLPSGPPRRPSRKGTLDLVTKMSPVVQSNLSPHSLHGYRQRESVVGDPGLSAQDKTPETGTGTDPQNGHYSHVEFAYSASTREQAGSTSTSSRLPVATQTPRPIRDFRGINDREDQGTHDAGGSVLGKLSSRLGRFGRRTKASGDENIGRGKGPAAGTGHEGYYGKYARRGRKGSVGSVSDGRDRSTSISSRPPFGQRTSQSSAFGSEIDDFTARRQQPVIIHGGGGYETRPDDDAPMKWPPSDWTTRGSESSLAFAKQVSSRPPGSVTFDSRSLSATSAASDASSSKAAYLGPAVFSSAVAGRNFPVQVPPSLDGYSTSQSSLVDGHVPDVAEIKGSGRSTLRNPAKASRSGRMLKWNFFQRKATSEESIKRVEDRGPESMRMSVVVAQVSTDKALPPYYALMDSENENDEGDDLEDLLQQIHDSPSSTAGPTSEPQGLGIRHQYGQSVLLPSMPNLPFENSRQDLPDSPRRLRKREVQPVGLASAASPQSGRDKPHRLPQVGRIPRVISRRDRHHKPPATSFSRPFLRENDIDAAKMVDDNAISVAETQRPILGIQTDVLPSQAFSNPRSGQPASAPAAPLGARALGDYESHPEWLVFPGSERPGISTVSSCDRALSMASTAPSAAHCQHIEEDEIWNEYDDLLDHVMSPRSPALAQEAGLSSSQPLIGLASPRRGEVRPESHVRLGTLDKTRHAANPTRASSLRSRPSSPATRAEMDHRLRRSRIVSALDPHSSMSPSSPFSVSDYTLGWADRSLKTMDSGRRFNGDNAVVPTLSSPAAHTCSLASPKLFETSHYQSTALPDATQRDDEVRGGQSDLRFAALATSRWLSFGRVLFSPAHGVIEAKPSQRVLVIDDGLGNDDWSFYCAVTYPTAVIYDLKEAADGPGSRREPSRGPWQAPSNYRKIEVSNLAERFPFPQSYFAVVVFRFPAAMSDTIVKMAFSECKRVLRPGGYLELTVLDLDIANMGSIARHALRDLKARMIGADPEVSLKPASDNIQKILAGRGFENLNRCVVGVPVAAKAGTSSGSRSSRSSQSSFHQKGREADQVGGGSPLRKRRSDHSNSNEPRGGSFSPNELFSEPSTSSDDEEILAQVGRWWYTRTYEWAALPGGDLDKSIWRDKRLLRECKARGSGFKLLIAYAQKPMETRRRSTSEPTRPTATVSGTVT